jgi:putative toxin-antitoxin system antitoxin component (TIGR02293 family)
MPAKSLPSGSPLVNIRAHISEIADVPRKHAVQRPSASKITIWSRYPLVSKGTELRLNVDEMARLLDIAARTINRKEKSAQPLSVSEADRAFRLARIADLAVHLIGDREKALSWLRTPNSYLGGKTPFAMLDTEVGSDFVTESLYSNAYGGVA